MRGAISAGVNARAAVVCALAALLAGCAYRLQLIAPPEQQRLKIVNTSPDRYAIWFRIRDPRQYAVAKDGRVTLEVPAYRRGCDVYLFDRIPLRRGADPFAAKTVEIVSGGQTVRKISLKEIAALPKDEEGYHLLALNR